MIIIEIIIEIRLIEQITTFDSVLYDHIEKCQNEKEMWLNYPKSFFRIK